MPKPRGDAQEIARQAWCNLPADKRTSGNVIKALKAIPGLKVPSKGSINRWAVHWRKVVENTADNLLPPLRPMVELTSDLKDVPQVLQDVLSPRLLHIGKGQGLDKVEDAIIQLAQAIASKAPEIADMLLDTETETAKVTTGEDGLVSETRTENAKVARSAVTALAQLAQSMQVITSSRTMLSLAHLQFSEGDLKLAQAHALLETGRADRAKEINGNGPAGHGGMSAAEEAFEALRGTTAKPPPTQK